MYINNSELGLPVYTIRQAINDLDSYGGKGCCVGTMITYNVCHSCPNCKYDLDIYTDIDMVSCRAIRIGDAC